MFKLQVIQSMNPKGHHIVMIIELQTQTIFTGNKCSNNLGDKEGNTIKGQVFF